MSKKVVSLRPRVPAMQRPRTLTTAEGVMDELRIAVFRSRQPYKVLAARCGVSPSTIGNFATGKTRWPRPQTFFSLLSAADLGIALVNKED